MLTERVGLDLVTFQDHPYQPAFLDTWTLMSYVAARTERVHISANVINLPLRPPGVLARAAAFILSSDEPQQIEQLARDVAPAVRATVASRRGSQP